MQQGTRGGVGSEDAPLTATASSRPFGHITQIAGDAQFFNRIRLIG
jgi:hypothetical protein